LFQDAFPALNVRSLIVNSIYDTWAIENVLGAKCVKGNDLSECNNAQLTAIQGLRERMMAAAEMFATRSNVALWMIACANHVYLTSEFYFSSPLETVPMHSDNTSEKAV
jgi:hypothetical protein